jgi:hypothetical protein
MGQNLTGQLISATYEDLVQISGSRLTDGTGSNINNLTVTASNATTASFALNAAGVANAVTTASVSNATITFTKGDASTFGITVNNVVNASTASFALNFNPAATASYALFAITSSFATLAADADNLDGNDGTFYRNANNINAGTLPATRLSGNYTINITGSVLGNATSASFAQNANLAATASFISGAIATASFAVNAGALDSQNGAFYRNADNINAGTLGSGRLAGSYSIDITGNAGTATSASFATFANDANNLDGNDGTYYRNADNINAGTLNANRLAGTYTIDIAGNASTATTASFATTANTANTATSASFATSASRAVSASFASTIANGLNINANTVTASAATFTNLTAVSASFGYVETTTGSAVIIGDAFIILNADSPTLPFAGIKVYDTGSASTASFEWNGNTDNWIVVEEGGTSAMILTGLTGSKGSEAAPAVNKLLKGTGNHTVANSNITDNGTLVTIASNTVITGSVNVTGSDVTLAQGSNLVTHHVKAAAVNGVEILNNSSGVVSLFGAGGSLGTTFYGQINATAISASSFISSSQFVGNLTGTATNATSASFASTATSASFASTATSASFALVATSASFATDATTAISASFASTASFVTTAQTASFFNLSSVTQNAVFSGSVRGEVNALSIASNTASINCSLDNFFTLLLVSGSNTHLSASNILPGQTINLRLNQPATGSGTITFNSSYDFAGGIPFTASLTASNVDVMTFISFDNTTLFGTGLKKFS